MEKCWKSHKTFIWLAWVISETLACSIDEAKAVIMAGKVKVNDLVIKDPDIGLGHGKHSIAVEGRNSVNVTVNGKLPIMNLDMDSVDEKALKHGDQIVVGDAVVKLTEGVLHVCYHKIAEEFVSNDYLSSLFGTGLGEALGGFTTSCMHE